MPVSQIVSSIHHGSSRPSATSSTSVAEVAERRRPPRHVPRHALLDVAEAEVGAERDPEPVERPAGAPPGTTGRAASSGRAVALVQARHHVEHQRAVGTVRVIGPMCDTVSTALAGYCAISPYVGFRPTAPQKPAGMRTDPAPSEPWCSGP